MRKKLFLPLTIVPLAAIGIATGASLSQKKDSYAYDDELAAIAAQESLSVEEVRSSLSTNKLLVKISDQSKLDDLGFKNYRNLVDDYYVVKANSLGDTIATYEALSTEAESVTLDDVSPRISIEQPKASPTNSDAISTQTNTYSWYGTNFVGIDDFQTGEGNVLIGVIDTGFNINHEALAGRVRTDLSGLLTSDGGIEHGTAVAGLIANATPDNQSMVLTVGGLDENGNIGLLEGIADLYNAGCRVVNMSVGINVEEGSEFWASSEAVLEGYKNGGMIMVGAVGNESTQEYNKMAYPAISNHVLSISAVDEDGDLSTFTNVGHGVIDFSAPGVNVRVADGNTNHGYEDGWEGTSFASPLVASAVADVLSVYDTYTYDGIYQYLVDNARDEAYYGHNFVDGYDGSFGHGIVHIDNNVSDYYEHYHYDENAINISFGDLSEDGGTQTINASSNYSKRIVAWEFVDGSNFGMRVRWRGLTDTSTTDSENLDISEVGVYTVLFVDEDGAVTGLSFNSVGSHEVVDNPPSFMEFKEETSSPCYLGENCTVTFTATASDDHEVAKIEYLAGDNPNSLQSLSGNTFEGAGGSTIYWKAIAYDNQGNSTESELRTYEIKGTEKPQYNPDDAAPSFTNFSATTSSPCYTGEDCTVTLTADATDDNLVSHITYYAGTSPDSLQIVQNNTLTATGGSTIYWKAIAFDNTGHSTESDVQTYVVTSTSKPQDDPGTENPGGDNPGSDDPGDTPDPKPTTPDPQPSPSPESPEEPSSNNTDNSGDKKTSDKSSDNTTNPNTGNKMAFILPGVGAAALIAFAIYTNKFRR